MLGFYEVGRGGLLLLPLPHSHLCAHPLFMAHRHAQAQKYTLPTLLLFYSDSQIFQSCWHPDCCQSVRPWCQCHSEPLTSLAPHRHSANPASLSLAGQQGSWGCRRPQLLFRAAEADMGKEVSDGIGRLSLIDFNSHILFCHNHHWLRIKYVYCSFLCDKNSQSGNMSNTLCNLVLRKSSFHPSVVQILTENLQKKMWIYVHFHPWSWEHHSPTRAIWILQEKRHNEINNRAAV